MSGRGKFFELLDFTKFAYPGVLGMDPVQTSYNVRDRLGGGGFMSYGMIWPRMAHIVSGRASADYISSQFSPYDTDWKNESIQGVVRLLSEFFGGRGTWYGHPLKPNKVLGFWFKPSIKGIWFVDGQAYAVLINARKSQRLFAEHVKFLARGVYELHCIDDPNDPIPLIIDVSAHDEAEGRRVRPYIVRPEEAATLEEFDDAVRQFLKALELAGVALPSDPDERLLDLFKRRGT
ncbi:hypothetical protein N2605_17480 [Bradyrhizobium yuanmingense]|uniref:hypothetical protein n=1 Tax=Bradyrhizobium yuanmingense TaxID=108015 RepID=UPI0021A2C2CD|nr:hypothetical protein [Bradyrhizobium sp. CB1024]UWU88163.1 hypothetical protein N2605_17480 [Bradyrhizobium sp. CB1024]